VSGQEATRCNVTACSLPSCRCSSTEVPGGFNASDVPQTIILSFDGAVTSLIYDNYYQYLFERKNPNGCPIKATFFNSHEYTNYSLINELYERGFELGVNSITKRNDQDFWINATPDEWYDEMLGMREMLDYYGNISIPAIVGSRAPFFLLGGNEYFGTLKNNTFQWDSSWPTRTFMNPGLWPYTLDYLSQQDCPVGRCPTNSFPGLWELPIVDLEDNQGNPCATLDQCAAGTTNVSVYQFLKRNFDAHYLGNRSPYSLSVSPAWFQNSINLQGFQLFVNDMANYRDVYFLSISQVLEWVKRPVKTTDLANFAPWQCTTPVAPRQCEPVYCSYSPDLTPSGETERVMTICNRPCPRYYPWFGNIQGNIPYRTTTAGQTTDSLPTSNLPTTSQATTRTTLPETTVLPSSPSM